MAFQMLGWLLLVGLVVMLLVYLLIVLIWDWLGFSFMLVYWLLGGFMVFVVMFCLLVYLQFESPHLQNKCMVLC